MWRVEVRKNGSLDHYIVLGSREEAINTVTEGNKTARALDVKYRYILAY